MSQDPQFLIRVQGGAGTTNNLATISQVIEGALGPCAQGSILVRGPNDWSLLTGGALGNVLASGGLTSNPLWASRVRLAKVAIVGVVATTGGAIASWVPPEGAPVIIGLIYLYTTVKSTGAANVSIGVAANTTTSAANLIDTLAVGSAALIADNITDASTNGKSRQLLSGSQALTVTGSADTSGLVGNLYITYIVP